MTTINIDDKVLQDFCELIEPMPKESYTNKFKRIYSDICMMQNILQNHGLLNEVYSNIEITELNSKYNLIK